MAAESIDLKNPQYYINRELSWIEFDRRCLSEARNKENPLFERLKFLSITASNLDEFFQVRVASLQDMVQAGYKKKDFAGFTATGQLSAVLSGCHTFMQQQYWTLNRQIIPDLEEQGLIMVRDLDQLSKGELMFIEEYFSTTVFPVLTPMAVDSSRPFPLIANKSLNIGALLTRKETSTPGILAPRKKPKKEGKAPKEKYEFATVQVPGVLPRIMILPGTEGTPKRLVLLEDVIRRFLPLLFVNYEVKCACPYRVLRSADFDISEDQTEDLLKEIKKQLKKRQRGDAIRLEVEKGVDEQLRALLLKELSLTEDFIFELDGPLDLTYLMKAYGIDGFDNLREHRYAKPQPVPEFPSGCDVFEQIRKGDVFMHHPYQTFDPVVKFVASAAADPDVLAIKQTLYRVSGNSPIIAALARAAENGKQVTVLVELKARFDEENNIVWASQLEKAGCHVIYGLQNLKTHSKITLVVRREEDGIRRYVHLGTGNYNDSTAKLYTDVGLMTCSDPIGEDATAVFNMISGYSEPRFWNKLSLAPLWLKNRFLHLIGREQRHAQNGESAHIIAKMNSLCDPDIMEALYAASCAGVKIELIVRGICCLRPGIPGVSENITVRSIVGNFLEHSRIYYFENGGSAEIYAASADWMPRNLDRRVEILFPLEDAGIRKKALHILQLELEDTVKAHIMRADGTYDRVDRRGKELINSQLRFCEEAVKEAKALMPGRDNRTFIPKEPVKAPEE